jgi:hypothetical protein
MNHSFLGPDVKNMTANEIIERVFSTSNIDEFVINLEIMKKMQVDLFIQIQKVISYLYP